MSADLLSVRYFQTASPRGRRDDIEFPTFEGIGLGKPMFWFAGCKGVAEQILEINTKLLSAGFFFDANFDWPVVRARCRFENGIKEQGEQPWDSLWSSPAHVHTGILSNRFGKRLRQGVALTRHLVDRDSRAYQTQYRYARWHSRRVPAAFRVPTCGAGRGAWRRLARCVPVPGDV